jgi:uncharacterized protein YcnI
MAKEFMMFKVKTKDTLALTALALFSGQVLAHVGIANAPLISGKTQEIILSVPHGCSEMVGDNSVAYDTLRIEVDIPTTLTGLRPLDNVFGNASIVRDDNGAIIKVIWAKDSSNNKGADSHHYNFSLRAKIAAPAFTTVYLPTTQYCMNADGDEITAAWTATNSAHGSHKVSAADATTSAQVTANPAPSFLAYPARVKGWNKYTAPDHLHDMSIFNDAEIMWKGEAAYSANPNTTALIKTDNSTTELSEIHPDEIFWVKY